MSARKWLNVRLRDIQAKVADLGHAVSLPVISRLLKAHDYRLQSNHKDAEGVSPPERDRQFAYIQEQRETYTQAGQPILSIDTKRRNSSATSRTRDKSGVTSLKS